jgi:hypothetical protein
MTKNGEGVTGEPWNRRAEGVFNELRLPYGIAKGRHPKNEGETAKNEGETAKKPNGVRPKLAIYDDD